MKKILAITLVAMVAATSVQADAISINWTQFTGPVNLVSDGYGVEAANNWNNSQGTTWNNQVLSSGGASTIDIEITHPAGLLTDASGTPGYDYTPLRSGAYVYGTPSVLVLSDISATFATYDLIVYGAGYDGAAGGNQGAYTVGGTTYYMQKTTTDNATLVQSSDIDSADGVDVGNYVVFSGLSGDIQTLTVSALNGSTGIGGIQVVGTVIPEPATLGLVAVFGGATLFIRRKLRI